MERTILQGDALELTFLNMERILQDFGKEAFLTREEAEEALEAMKK